MKSMEDKIIDMQVRIAELLMEKWSKTPQEFIELDKKYSILEYIRVGYEPFHLTGDKGIVAEVEAFVTQQGGAW